MTDSKDKQSLSGQQISHLPASSNSPSDKRLNAPIQTGQNLLQHMEETIAEKSPDANFSSDSNFLSIPSFKPDDILAGKYQIIKFISRGNAGMVYQARHLMLNRVFAIKVLSPSEPVKEVSNERFQREAHAAASLSHPNIISVLDFGTLANGALYLAMEYLEGETLASVLDKQTRLDFEDAMPLFIQICLALEYAHTQGVIHRDLKPSNIMIIKDYKGDHLVKVIDFSIAKFVRRKPNQRTITKPGQIFGTPLYMSPEQCQGKKPDHRSDIYSFGCVMYETLCGAPPLMGDSLLNTIYKHVNELPTPFSQHVKDPSIPRELEAIVFKALAKQPENRYQSAADMRAALELFNRQYQSQLFKFGPPPALYSSTPKLNKILTSLLLFLLACFVLVLCIFLNARMMH